MFGIAVWRPLVVILRIVGLIQGPFWGHFAHFVADVAKLKSETILREKLGFRDREPPFLQNCS